MLPCKNFKVRWLNNAFSWHLWPPLDLPLWFQVLQVFVIVNSILRMEAKLLVGKTNFRTTETETLKTERVSRTQVWVYTHCLWLSSIRRPMGWQFLVWCHHRRNDQYDERSCNLLERYKFTLSDYTWWCTITLVRRYMVTLVTRNCLCSQTPQNCSCRATKLFLFPFSQVDVCEYPCTKFKVQMVPFLAMSYRYICYCVWLSWVK